MKRQTQFLVGALLLGVVALVVLAVKADDSTQAFTMGFAAIFGLCSIAFTQHLDAQAALQSANEERLQQARGLARSFASELEIFSSALSVKEIMLPLEAGGESASADPDTLLTYIRLPERAVFDANVDKVPLLEVMEEFDEAGARDMQLVERVVAFYESAADFRSAVADAKLQNRRLTAKEIAVVQGQMRIASKFADSLAKSLREVIRLSRGTHSIHDKMPLVAPPNKSLERTRER